MSLWQLNGDCRYRVYYLGILSVVAFFSRFRVACSMDSLLGTEEPDNTLTP